MLLFKKANHFICKWGESKQTKQAERNGLYATTATLYINSADTKDLELLCFLKTHHIHTKCYVWKRFLMTSFHTVKKEVNNNQAHTYCVRVNALQREVQMQSNAAKRACAFNTHLIFTWF